MKNNSISPQEETLTTEKQIVEVEKEEETVAKTEQDVGYKSPSNLAFQGLSDDGNWTIHRFCSNAMIQKFQQGLLSG